MSPTWLGRSYPTDWRGDPPHMLKPDIPIWYRFLDQNKALFINLYYDVLLGGPYATEEEMKDPTRRMWVALTSKRADVIAELEKEVWIIEVTKEPGLRAIGQLMSYRTLWIRDPKIIKPEKMVLICEIPDTDLFDVAGMHGMLVFVI